MIAGGVALGLVASRFLKASAGSRYEQRSQGYAQLPARTSSGAPATSGGHTEPVGGSSARHVPGVRPDHGTGRGS